MKWIGEQTYDLSKWWDALATDAGWFDQEIAADTGIVYLTGNSYGQSSAVATMRMYWRMLGVSTGVSTTAGAIRKRMRLTGASTGQSATSAAMRVRARLSGSSAGHSADSAAIRMRWRMLGLSAGQSAASATIGGTVAPPVVARRGSRLLYQHLRERQPGGRVLYLSGRSDGRSRTQAAMEVDDRAARAAEIARFRGELAALEEKLSAEELELVVALLLADAA